MLADELIKEDDFALELENLSSYEDKLSYYIREVADILERTTLESNLAMKIIKKNIPKCRFRKKKTFGAR